MVPKPTKGDWDMKRKLLLVIIATISLSGCSSVSQKEYDTKVNELTTLQDKYESMTKEFSNKENTYLENTEITLNFDYGERKGIYTGQIKDGIPHGEGTFKSINDDSSSWTYRGEWNNGHFSGYGTTVWDTGEIYTGNYLNDYMNGKGIYLNKDGNIISGKFKDGQIDILDLGSSIANINGDESESRLTETEPKENKKTETELDFDAMDKQVQQDVDNATDVTSGEVYDFINSINSKAKLMDIDGSLYINIPIEKSNPNSETAKFFTEVTDIIYSDKIADNYDSISCSLLVNEKAKGTLTFLSISRLGDFTTSTPIIYDSEYEKDFNSFYESIFSTYSIDSKYEKGLDDIAEKYGLKK